MPLGIPADPRTLFTLTTFCSRQGQSRCCRTSFKTLTMAIHTRVLLCDKGSISFTDGGKPIFASADTHAALNTAAFHLAQHNEVLAFPTETVYGLGANAFSPEAIAKIFATKGRPADNPLIVHVSSIQMLQSFLPPDYVISATYCKLMKHFWPGALTLLFPANRNHIPAIVTANQSTVGVRMPSHPVARALIALADRPLAAPSANTSGRPSPTRAAHVLDDLDGKVGIILDGGPCDIGLESTVVDGLHPDGRLRVLRPGGVTVEDMERVLNDPAGLDEPMPQETDDLRKILVHKRDFNSEELEQAPTTPGMKYRHYSPTVPVLLIMGSASCPEEVKPVKLDEHLAAFRRHQLIDMSSPLRVGLLTTSDSSIENYLPHTPETYEYSTFTLGPKDSLAMNAARLFDGLLTLEKAGVHIILVESMNEAREGLAYMNRAMKAASQILWLQQQ